MLGFEHVEFMFWSDRKGTTNKKILMLWSAGRAGRLYLL